MTASLPFIDLKAQYAHLKNEIDAGISDVLEHGGFIMGKEVHELEAELSAFCGAKHSISCSSGTDALALGLMALGVRPGHAIFVPSFTFCATAEVVAWLGATAVFVDVEENTFNMCSESLEQAITFAKSEGLQCAGIIPVDLFGHPADYNTIQSIADAHSMWVMGDSAQGFGGLYHGKCSGTLAKISATSFFPAKPLGCYGDGGAVFTDDDDLAEVMRSLRVHGKGSDKYDNVRIGMNARLDTLQAAILRPKLAAYPKEIDQRNAAAARYAAGLAGIDSIRTPMVAEHCTSVWAQYTLILDESIERSALQASLKESGIPTAIYYPKPLHQQTAYARYPSATGHGGALPVSERLSQKVLSLPMHPYMQEADSQRVCDALQHALATARAA